MVSFGSYFSERMQNRKSVFGLRRRVRIAYGPIPWSAQGDQHIEERKGHISEPFFFSKHIGNIRKRRAPKGLQMGEFISGVAPLGAPLPSFGAPIRFCYTKNEPTVSPKCSQDAKMTPQMIPKDPKSATKCLQKCQVHSLGHLN